MALRPLAYRRSFTLVGVEFVMQVEGKAKQERHHFLVLTYFALGYSFLPKAKTRLQLRPNRSENIGLQPLAQSHVVFRRPQRVQAIRQVYTIMLWLIVNVTRLLKGRVIGNTKPRLFNF